MAVMFAYKLGVFVVWKTAQYADIPFAKSTEPFRVGCEMNNKIPRFFFILSDSLGLSLRKNYWYLWMLLIW